LIIIGAALTSVPHALPKRTSEFFFSFFRFVLSASRALGCLLFFFLFSVCVIVSYFVFFLSFFFLSLSLKI
jgi:hypothetical protein